MHIPSAENTDRAIQNFHSLLSNAYNKASIWHMNKKTIAAYPLPSCPYSIIIGEMSVSAPATADTYLLPMIF